MTMTVCLDCRDKVSSSARTCPHCGCPVKRSRPREGSVRVARIALLLVALYLALWPQNMLAGSIVLVAAVLASFRWRWLAFAGVQLVAAFSAFVVVASFVY